MSQALKTEARLNFPKVKKLCAAMRACHEGLTVETGEAWRHTFSLLNSLHENEVAGVFKERCRANQKKKEIGTGGIEPPTSC